MKKWYKLDNVGKFYASTSNSKIPKVFRYSAYLTDNIEENILQEALNKTIIIYPNFSVNLKKGIFWYYLDETNKKNKVTKENLPICFKIYNNSDDFLYRVSYYKNKINIEVSHILSDGRGSVEFFKLLLTNYISLKYNLNTKQKNNTQLEKAEDSYIKYYEKSKYKRNKNLKTYIYKRKKYRNQTQYLECYTDVKSILELAHKYDTTLTIFLTSVLIYSFRNELKVSELNKYIKIDLPVDLRTYFNSHSSMNFFGLTTITYKFNSKNVELEDIIKDVKKQFEQKIISKELAKRANYMVSFEKNWFCRFAPIFLKNIVLNLADKLTNNTSTTCLSNIGVIKLDSKIEEKINSISVLTSTNNFQITTCTFKDQICIGIANTYTNNDIIKNFCCYFSQNNIKLKINVSEVK